MADAKKPAARKPATTRRKAPALGSAKKSTVTSTAAKRRARAATRKATQSGAVGRRLDLTRQRLRDSMIVAGVGAGEDKRDVAKRAGVTVRTVERIVAAAEDVRSPLERTPMELLEAMARDHMRTIADLESMAFAWLDLNQSAALGAKKAAGEERARLAALFAEVGKLPSNLELFRSEMEMQRIGEEMGRALLAVRDGSMTLDDAIEVFLNYGRRPAQIEASAVEA